MADIVIVTKGCYLVCQSVTSISLNDRYNDEIDDDYKLQKSPKKKSKVVLNEDIILFEVNIHFIVNGNKNGNSSDLERECTVSVRGRAKAEALFNSIVDQIREQLPDKLWLDTYVDRLLGNEPKEKK
jgi:hypothetical protein